MIDLYSWKTSNGKKASIMLEECGLDYEVHPINIGQDEQFTPAYLAINPNGKIPIVQHEVWSFGFPLISHRGISI